MTSKADDHEQLKIHNRNKRIRENERSAKITRVV